ncbi:MAG: competence/damage-inducible protein A [Eubacteriales bacterium]
MIKIKNAEILCVGTEILIGDIVNTNAAFISKRLAALGINQYYQAVVGDNPERLSHMINEALGRCELLIMSGGLGPTYDDLTKETAAACMGRTLALHQPSYERLCGFFEQRGIKMTENNKKQVYMPQNSIVFQNDRGTAPGCAIEDEERGKIIIMLPGPPRELEPMFTESVEPYLAKFSDHIFYSRNINIVGMGESAVEDILKPLMTASENPTVAPYCKEGEVRLRVTARCADAAEGEKMCRDMIARIEKTEVGAFVYGIDAELETAVVEALAARSLHAATAESCTGGLISQRITSVSGSSEVFDGGIVSYANRIKAGMLGVSEATLAEHGAVSPETAREMAIGVRNVIGADFGVSVTGIAGPGGGTSEKPVGLVYIACADAVGCEVKRLDLGGSREHIRHLTSNYALSLLLSHIRSK